MHVPRRLPIGLSLFTVAYLLRLVYLFQIARSPLFDFIQLDPLYYLTWAREIASGNWIGGEVFEMSPLYSYLLAVYLGWIGEDLWVLRLLQIGAGAITCVLTWLLGERLFDRRVGVIAGAACAVYGPFYFYEGQVMKEFLTPLLATAALLLLLRSTAGAPGGPSPSRWPLAGCGALLAMAALVRDNFLVVLALLGGWLLLSSRRRVAAVLPLVAGAAVVLAPVALRNFVVGGDIVLTTSGGGEVFYIGNSRYANGAYVWLPWVTPNPAFEHEDFREKARELTGRDLTRAQASRFWWRQGLLWIVDNPGRALLLWGRKFALFWNDHEVPDNYSYYSFAEFSSLLSRLLTFGPVAAFAWAGVWVSRRSWRRLMPVYMAGAGYMLSVLIFFNYARFRLPLLPILMVFAGHGAVTLLGRLRESWRSRRLGRPLAEPFAILIVALPFMYLDLSSAAEEPFQDRLHLAAAYRQAGQHADAVEVLRRVIRDAEDVIRRSGGDPSRRERIPGGIPFVMALSAAHRDLGGALADQGRQEAAVSAYERALELTPDDVGLRLKLAASMKGAGRASDALPVLREATRLAPDSFAAGFDLATVLHDLGRPAEAMAELEGAFSRAAPLSTLDEADYHYGRGAILLSMHRDAEAIAALEKGLRLNPEAPLAAQAREVIRELGVSPDLR